MKFLADELRKFERSFSKYLNSLINEEYKSRASEFIYRLFGDKVINVLNFNYTTLDRFNIKNQINIHGKLNEEIIIGIDATNNKDSNNTKVKAPKYSIDSFTKTYRNLHRLNSRISLPTRVSEIVLYGHSLGKADFSYFYSIFDMYKLYDSDLKLKFLYSEYEETPEKNQIIHDKYVSSIYNLINQYSLLAHNESNLLHRLILEGRILIEKV